MARYILGLLSTSFCLFFTAAAAEVHRVGPGRAYTQPSQAAARAASGDVIEIDAGKYVGDVAVWRQNDLTIRGVGGYAHIEAAGQAAEGKAIWVVKGDRTLIENIELSGAAVADSNGAGIRQEGAGLRLRNCYLHDNENGILGGAGDVVIERSEFARNGAGDGRTHNIYISVRTDRFELRESYVHHARVGHNVKSRARETHLVNNRIMDEQDGNSSYAVDLPNGGMAYIVGNLLQQGPRTENMTVVSYGAEGLRHPDNEVYIVNNTLVNDADKPARFVVVAPRTTHALLQNNLFVGPGKRVSGPAGEQTNLADEGAELVDRQGYDYRLRGRSAAIDSGSEPPAALRPLAEYRHPRSSVVRPQWGAIDIGAHEYAGAGGRETRP